MLTSEALTAVLSDADLTNSKINESLSSLFQLAVVESPDRAFEQHRDELISCLLPDAISAYNDAGSLVTGVVECLDYCKEYHQSAHMLPARAKSQAEKLRQDSETVTAKFVDLTHRLAAFSIQIRGDANQIQSVSVRRTPMSSRTFRKRTAVNGVQNPLVPAGKEVGHSHWPQLTFLKTAMERAQHAFRAGRFRLLASGIPQSSVSRTSISATDDSFPSLVPVSSKPRIRAESRAGTMADIRVSVEKLSEALKSMDTFVHSIHDFSMFLINDADRRGNTRVEGNEQDVDLKNDAYIATAERADEIFERCWRFLEHCRESENLVWAIAVRIELNKKE
jgi:hypothetical protein